MPNFNVQVFLDFGEGGGFKALMNVNPHTLFINTILKSTVIIEYSPSVFLYGNLYLPALTLVHKIPAMTSVKTKCTVSCLLKRKLVRYQ